MLGSSLSPVSVVNSGLRERDAGTGAESRVLRHERCERGLRLPAAAIDQDFAAPAQPKTGPGTPENPGNPCKRRRSSAGRALHS